MKYSRKRKKVLNFFSRLIIFLLLSAGCLLIISAFLAVNGIPGRIDPVYVYTLIRFLLFICVAVYAQGIIHLLGQMVFGKAAGLKLSGVSIGPLTLVRNGKRLRPGSGRSVGVLSQPVMSASSDTTVSGLILYSLGGCIFILVSSLLFLLLARFFKHAAGLYMFTAAVTGLMRFIYSAVPCLRDSPNDGRIALDCLFSERARRAFSDSLRISGIKMQGLRLAGLTDELFPVPVPEDLESSVASRRISLYTQRLFDDVRLRQAGIVFDNVLTSPGEMPESSLEIIRCNRLFAALISGEDPTEFIPGRAELRRMEKMENSPEILRTRYALEKIWFGDERRARKIRKAFDSFAKKYIYKGDIAAEKELMRLVDRVVIH